MADQRKFVSGVCAVLASSVLALTGCGVGTRMTVADVGASAPAGKVHGGSNPVAGAVVNLYATTSNGYGAAPALLATATTASDGSFHFASAAACPSGQQAYVTALGGDPGSGTNPNYLLMAALGDCANVSSATVIWIDEVTTIAAAFALRPFISIGGTADAPIVQIGAPATNNGSIGSCTAIAGVTAGCTAAGLSHAFANALNLANSVSVNGVNPNGTAYQVAPSNPSGSVPSALINSLANSLVACVNSQGATTRSTPCGMLFSFTTPPGGAAPTNTLQSMMNLAQSPTLNTGGIYMLATPQTMAYLPTLSAAPTDYSIAIAYTGPTVAGVLSQIVPAVNNPSGFGSGTGYTSVPSLILSGGSPTTPATATALLGVTYWNVAGSAGTCTNTPNSTVQFSPTGGGGSGAVVSVTYNSSGVPVSGAVVAPGSGYTSVPAFVIPCTAGSQPGANFKVKGLGVVGATITNPGAGYMSAPTVAIAASNGSGTGGNGAPAPLNAAATASIAAQSTPAAYAMSLDADDHVYVGWQNAAGNAGANSFVTGYASNGSPLFTSSPSTAYTAPRGSATDTLNHVWIAENNTNTVLGLNTTDGSVFQTVATGAAPFGLAADKANNIWYGTAGIAAQNLFELQQSNSYASATFAPNVPQFGNPVRSIAFDANQNIYVSGYNATTNTGGLFANTGTALAPVYGTYAPVSATLTGANGAGIALDASANAWTATTTGLFELTPGFPGSAPPTFSPSAPLADNAVVPNYVAVDGAGSIWITNNSLTTAPVQSINQYIPATATANSYSPCYAPGGAAICSAGLNLPQRVQVDSTGSVWITSVTNGMVYQLIGTGTPTWPQLSLSQPGTEP